MNIRNFLNRTGVILLTAVLLTFSMLEVSFATERPALKTEANAACSGQKEERPSGAVICSIHPISLPYASDETDQGRVYINASSGRQLRRTFSLKRHAWLFSTIIGYRLSFTREICSQGAAADSFDDLFIIHFIHNQDGQKG